METVIEVIVFILTLTANWMIFKKMGHEGWEGIIPLYNTFILCKDLKGSGWKMLFFLIPIYNIIFAFQLNIALAKKFGKKPAFGIGLTLLSTIFYMILAFGDSKCVDVEANSEPDFVSNVVEKATSTIEAKVEDVKEDIKEAKEAEENKEE